MTGHQLSSGWGTCCSNLQYTSLLVFIEKMSVPTTSHGLCGISYGVLFPYGCLCWYSRHVAQCFTVFSMSTFIFTQYTLTCILAASSFLFLYCCSAAAVISVPAIEKELFFYPLLQCPQLLPTYFLLASFVSKLCSRPSFLHGQPCIIYAFRSCKCVPSHVPACMSPMDLPTVMYTEAPRALIYVHSHNLLVFVLCVIVVRQPFHDV